MSDDESSAIVITTPDLGPIAFPNGHTPWCNRSQHRAYAKECSGHDSAAELCACRSRLVAGTMGEITDAEGRVLREHGGRWEATVARYRRPPYQDASNWAGPARFELVVFPISFLPVTVEMTAGEIRTMATQLLALVDDVECGE